jgi:DNA-binding transcriptional MerR regulator
MDVLLAIRCTPSTWLEGQGDRTLGPMLIGEVALRSGIPAHTIRFYEDQKLVTRAARSPAGYRLYPDRVLDELRFIRRAQGLGLTLDETREILSIGRAGRKPCERVAAICATHLAEIERRLAELQTFRHHLREAKRLAEKGCGFTREGFCRAIFSDGETPES